MNTIPTQRLLGGLLALGLMDYVGVGIVGSNTTQHIVIDSVDTARSREAARQSQEKLNVTHILRNKVNMRVEKDFDRYDQAADLQAKCNGSQNVNAYWEPNTSRCLDRRTGRSLHGTLSPCEFPNGRFAATLKTPLYYHIRMTG